MNTSEPDHNTWSSETTALIDVDEYLEVFRTLYDKLVGAFGLLSENL